MNVNLSNQNQFVTVTLLNKYIKTRFEDDVFLRKITIKGQVSNFTDHFKTGHFYFTLKDESSSIKAVMFNSYAKDVLFDVKNGMDVLVTGTVSVFERDGVYQLYCYNMEPFGVGAMHLAFEQLKQKLLDEGLFSEENKKPLKRFPQSIAVVTSSTGAALQDINDTLKRRYPIITPIVYPCLVQGTTALESVLLALEKADNDDNDVIILARGGGSSEDLSVFNDEKLARKIYALKTPIITGIGHEIDFTIADFVSDVRAATPTAAAVLATPDIKEMKNNLLQQENNLKEAFRNLIDKKHEKLNYNKLVIINMMDSIIKDNSLKLIDKEQKINEKINRIIEKKQDEIAKKAETLENLSPLKVMSRGYAIVTHQNMMVQSANTLKNDDVIDIRFADSTVKSKVIIG